MADEEEEPDPAVLKLAESLADLDEWHLAAVVCFVGDPRPVLLSRRPENRSGLEWEVLRKLGIKVKFVKRDDRRIVSWAGMNLLSREQFAASLLVPKRHRGRL